MEIRDYLRAIRRILWLVIAIPIIAGLAVGGFIEEQPSVYQAQATAVVPAITANGISQSAASQYIDTFKDVLTSQSVVPYVAQAGFGLTESELVTGLSANTVTASSNYVIVTLLGKHGQNLVAAVKQAAIDTMNAIAEPQVVQAANELSNAQTLLAKATTAINDFDSNGNLVPQVTYTNELSTLNNQLAELQTLKIDNDTAHIAGLSNAIVQTRAQLAVDATQLQTWLPLNSALQAAQGAYEHATQDQVDAKALVAADAAPGVVTTTNVVRLSKLSDVIKFAAIAFALALLMMLGLILILELMHSGRQQKVPATSQQGAFAWPPPAAQTRPTGPPAAAAMAAAPPAAASLPPRDPWRATPDATVAPGGNGHTNGNGQPNAPEVETEPQRAGGGLFRRR
jgi:hypothetical protein